jgi:23S rRNA (uracil1939-C5)-methyltransferase
LGISSLAKELMKECSDIKGVIHNFNNNPGNTVLGKKFQTIEGEGFIEEQLCGLTFKISPASFFQVNPQQAEKLYAKAIELAALSGNERVLDAFCGVGTLSLCFAQKAKQVIGVECVREAIVDAKDNARRNNMQNVSFVCDQAEKFIQTIDSIDVAVVNPPRKGCEPSFINKLSNLKPKKIIYISCDPATLARDLKALCEQGYHIDTVQPLDMFPQTAHVECIVKLSL